MTSPGSLDDTWDAMRSQVWDLIGPDGKPVDDLPLLLGLIGAGTMDRAGQRAVLADWPAGPAYQPAPAALKDKIREFLGRQP